MFHGYSSGKTSLVCLSMSFIIFFDRGFFIRFRNVLALVQAGEVDWEIQRFTNSDGTAASPKRVVKIPYVICRDFGIVAGQTLESHAFVDKNGKVMTYVTFENGEIKLAPDVFEEWGS